MRCFLEAALSSMSVIGRNDSFQNQKHLYKRGLQHLLLHRKGQTTLQMLALDSIDDLRQSPSLFITFDAWHSSSVNRHLLLRGRGRTIPFCRGLHRNLISSCFARSEPPKITRNSPVQCKAATAAAIPSFLVKTTNSKYQMFNLRLYNVAQTWGQGWPQLSAGSSWPVANFHILASWIAKSKSC